MALVPTPQQLRTARRASGLTQGELAARAGTSRATIARMESDRSQYSVSTETLCRVCDVLGVGSGPAQPPCVLLDAYLAPLASVGTATRKLNTDVDARRARLLRIRDVIYSGRSY